jgi:hypothetical protein
MEVDGKVLHCGIGWSIPDELYMPEFEGHPASVLVVISERIGELYPEGYGEGWEGFVCNLQICHDEAERDAFMESFLSEMWQFAQKWHMTWPEDVPRPD